MHTIPYHTISISIVNANTYDTNEYHTMHTMVCIGNGMGWYEFICYALVWYALPMHTIQGIPKEMHTISISIANSKNTIEYHTIPWYVMVWYPFHWYGMNCIDMVCIAWKLYALVWYELELAMEMKMVLYGMVLYAFSFPIPMHIIPYHLHFHYQCQLMQEHLSASSACEKTMHPRILLNFHFIRLSM
jgi:hypothetical protein